MDNLATKPSWLDDGLVAILAMSTHKSYELNHTITGSYFNKNDMQGKKSNMIIFNQFSPYATIHTDFEL